MRSLLFLGREVLVPDKPCLLGGKLSLHLMTKRIPWFCSYLKVERFYTVMERMNLPAQLSPLLLFIQVSSYFLPYLSWIYFWKCLKLTVEVSSKNESFGTGVRAGNTLESIYEWKQNQFGCVMLSAEINPEFSSEDGKCETWILIYWSEKDMCSCCF